MDRAGSNRLLTNEQDLVLKAYIDRCDQIGMPALVPQIKSAAQLLLDKSHPELSAPPLGKDWVTRWLQRNPDCRRVRQKPRNIERSASDEKALYEHYFRAYKRVVTEHGIASADIYNMDETGFRIGVGGSQWIITRDWRKPKLSPLEINRDFATSVEVISGDGVVLPLLIIL